MLLAGRKSESNLLHEQLPALSFYSQSARRGVPREGNKHSEREECRARHGEADNYSAAPLPISWVLANAVSEARSISSSQKRNSETMALWHSKTSQVQLSTPCP